MAWRRLANFLLGRNPAEAREHQQAADVGLAWLLTEYYRSRGSGCAPDAEALVEKMGQLHLDARAKAVQKNINLQVIQRFQALERSRSPVFEHAAAEVERRRRFAAQDVAALDRFETLLGAQRRTKAHVEEKEIYAPNAQDEAVASAMQEEFGYAACVKRSTIQGAGRGLFVQGKAPRGAVLGLFPGLVHLPENLKNPAYYREAVESDTDFMILARYDWHLIDCRMVDEVPQSAWALAHMANHPPPGTSANAMYIAYDFPVREGGLSDQPAGDAFPSELRRWVPNRYLINPALLGGKIDRSMSVEGAALLALRDLCDEEVFLDYRLNPDRKDKLPHWYTPADAAAARRRWLQEK